MGKRLENKVVIITGATSGIGKASVELFAEEGGKIVFAARREEKGKAIEADLRGKGYEVTFIQADVTVTADLENLVKATLDKHGRIDVLFNNAGVSIFKRFEELTMGDYDKIMNLNIRGCFEACKLVLPHMIKQGGGSIVNTSSIGGVVGSPLLTAYNASKGAVHLFTKGLAAEVAEHKVRVNALMPGLTLTEMTAGSDEFMEIASAGIPMKRAADPREIAYGALFLASDESSFMTGSQLIMDGGFTAV